MIPKGISQAELSYRSWLASAGLWKKSLIFTSTKGKITVSIDDDKILHKQLQFNTFRVLWSVILIRVWDSHSAAVQSPQALENQSCFQTRARVLEVTRALVYRIALKHNLYVFLLPFCTLFTRLQPVFSPKSLDSPTTLPGEGTPYQPTH